MNRIAWGIVSLLVFACFSAAQSAPKKSATKPATVEAQDWTTPAERSGYRTTPRYDETMAYLRRIAEAAPKQVRIETFGKTSEGRDLVAVLVSRDGIFDPATLHKQNRPIVLVQNAIHAGEMDGKDACLALLRDIVIRREKANLIERAVLVIVPIYNADGHERFGPYNRINQNGPEQMGWRVTALNLNLNRDYMKADAPETRALLKLWTRWLPDFHIDNHVTDGADYQYDVTYSIESGPEVHPEQAQWIDNELLPYMKKSIDASGHVFGPYIWLVDETDLSKGMVNSQIPGRFANGFGHLQNRPSMLIEMHMLKDYKTRVTGNYEAMRAMLEIINRDADKLVGMNRAADEAVVTMGREANSTPNFPIRLRATGKNQPLDYKGFRFNRKLSDVSGGMMVEYSNEPFTITIPVQEELKPTLTIATPRAYIVPAQWTSVIGLLEAHGLQLRRTTKSWTGEVETYRCEQPNWSERPFEGRHMASWPNLSDQNRACRLSREQMNFPAGSVVVPLDQRAAKIAIHLLEPEAPDSFVAWGFFDSVFEQKEYAEGYVLEKLAREMMAKDPKLKAEFEQRVHSDPKFAADATERLNFFYRRSPWWDPELGRIPVGRLTTLDGVLLQ